MRGRACSKPASVVAAEFAGCRRATDAGASSLRKPRVSVQARAGEAASAPTAVEQTTRLPCRIAADQMVSALSGAVKPGPKGTSSPSPLCRKLVVTMPVLSGYAPVKSAACEGAGEATVSGFTLAAGT